MCVLKKIAMRIIHSRWYRYSKIQGLAHGLMDEFWNFFNIYIIFIAWISDFAAPSRPLPDMPRLHYDDSDALKLTWKPPVVDTKRPLRYQIQMQAPQSLDWRPLATGINDTSYRIRGLGPSRDYMFRVIPETSLGPLEPLPPVSLTALPGKPRFIYIYLCHCLSSLPLYNVISLSVYHTMCMSVYGIVSMSLNQCYIFVSVLCVIFGIQHIRLVQM
jgi:hypothetical protein